MSRPLKPVALLEDGSAYQCGNLVLPRVTNVLSRLTDWDAIDPYALEFARQRGTAVHAACDLADRGVLEWESVDPRILGYVMAWDRFRDSGGFTVLHSELTVASRKIHLYGGTLDRILLRDGTYFLVDIKTGAPTRATGPQLAAYEHSDEVRGIAHPLKRVAVWLRPALDPPYTMISYTDRADFEVFSACLTLHQWEQRNAK